MAAPGEAASSRPPIPHSRPDLGPDEAEAARAVVAGGHVAQGAQVAAFEAEVADAVGRRHGVATSSGTAALHLVLQALGVAGGRVAIPAYVCTALLHAARAAGAEAVALDVDGANGNLDGTVPVPAGCVAAVVPHMFGRPAPAAASLAPHLPVIEDLAMALGAGGVGRTGLAAVCSFYATKVITAGGEGGMVLTDDDGLARAVREVREYDGLAADRLRWNCKMTDLAAAVGRVQLRRLPGLLARRAELAARYDRAARDWGVGRLPAADDGIAFRYVVNLPDGDVDPAIDAFAGAGIAARRPVSPALHAVLPGAEDRRGTQRMLATALSLPLYPSLTDAEAERVIAAAGRVLAAAAVQGGVR